MRAMTGMIAAASVSFAIAASAQSQTPNQALRVDGYVTTPDGVRLYYQKVGTSPQVVIQPGRLFAFADFKWLGEHFTLISYDMRNRGRSELVADVEAVRRHFGVERLSLLGYSYLGKIAILYALEHPDRVDRVVQFGPCRRVSALSTGRSMSSPGMRSMRRPARGCARCAPNRAIT